MKGTATTAGAAITSTATNYSKCESVPRMNSYMPIPPQHSSEITLIGKRLQGIADGIDFNVDPKRYILSTLNDVMNCVQRW